MEKSTMNSYSCITFIAVLIATLPALAFEFFEPVQPPRSFQVMAHRGALVQAPENTAPALERCIEDGFEWAEVDVRLTKDGKHVIFHDGGVDGKSNGTGEISDLTLAEIKALDVGSWFSSRFAVENILTLKECLDLCKDRLNLYLDCKAVNPELLVDEIMAAGMEKQVVVFDALEVLATIKELSQERIPIMPKWHPAFGTTEWVAKWKPDAVEINADEVTPEICTYFHEQGVIVQAKVLGDKDRPEVWRKMRTAGVDWFQTDLSEEVLAQLLWVSRRNRPVQIAHHRGANRYAPENTLPAFEKSIRLGADYVEIDIRTTKDGAFFILHDGNLDRTTNGKGAISEADGQTVATLEALEDFGRPFLGVKVPTLDEALATLAGKTNLYVDAKVISPEALAEKLSEYGIVDQSMVYQSPEYLQKLKAINPDIRALCPLSDVSQIEDLCNTVRPYAFDASWKILSEEMIRICHEQGVQVFSDAIGRNERIEVYQQAITWGIDLIQTDHPLRVIRAVELMQIP